MGFEFSWKPNVLYFSIILKLSSFDKTTFILLHN